MVEMLENSHCEYYISTMHTHKQTHIYIVYIYIYIFNVYIPYIYDYTIRNCIVLQEKRVFEE